MTVLNLDEKVWRVVVIIVIRGKGIGKLNEVLGSDKNADRVQNPVSVIKPPKIDFRLANHHPNFRIL